MDMTVPIKVHHKEYGDGEVIKTTEEKIYVKFAGKQMIFPYPEALEKGYLTASGIPESTGENPQDESEFLRPEDIKHRIIVIKINQRYERNMNPDDLYNSVRGIWKASRARAEKADYAFGVYQSLIVAVYKPTEWYVCKEAQDRLPRKDIVLSAKNENRIFFEDKSYEQGLPLDENQQFYIGKSIAKLTMNKNSQNPITYLEPGSEQPMEAEDSNSREVIVDVSEMIKYGSIYEAINSVVGTEYTGWMKAVWPSGNKDLPYCIWFPKLAETKNGEVVPAANDCINTISADWNEVIYEYIGSKQQNVDDRQEDPNSVPTLIFAKEPKGGPYIFRGVYIPDAEKSRNNYYVSKRIGTRIKLIGKPADQIEILDDFRS